MRLRVTFPAASAYNREYRANGKEMMAGLRVSLLLVPLMLSGGALADVDAGEIPADAAWYLHVDLEELRSAASGRQLYRWLDEEVFTEIRDDLGIDLDREADAVTAFGDAVLGTVIVVNGDIRQSTRDKLMALAAADAMLETRSHGGRTYIHADRSDSPQATTNHRSLDDLQKGAWFSFDVDGKLIVTSSEDQMKALLDSGGRLAGNQDHAGALFVLTADRNFMQAGVRTDQFGSGKGSWDSNILRHTEQIALLVADREGHIALEAQLVSREPQMARSLAGILNGLISLQMLDDDMDPQLLQLIQNTRIDVKDAVLSVNTVLDAAAIAALIEGGGRAASP